MERTVNIQNPMSSPEAKYPAVDEDIDTIIAGTDGKDYIVDIMDGMKQWVLYLPEANDEIVIQKVLPPINDLPKLQAEPVNVAKGANKYQVFMSEITKQLKKDHPEMTSGQRREMVSKLWKEKKESD